MLAKSASRLTGSVRPCARPVRPFVAATRRTVCMAAKVEEKKVAKVEKEAGEFTRGLSRLAPTSKPLQLSSNHGCSHRGIGRWPLVLKRVNTFVCIAEPVVEEDDGPEFLPSTQQVRLRC